MVWFYKKQKTEKIAKEFSPSALPIARLKFHSFCFKTKNKPTLSQEYRKLLTMRMKTKKGWLHFKSFIYCPQTDNKRGLLGVA